jgi:hypothetical protein
MVSPCEWPHLRARDLRIRAARLVRWRREVYDRRVVLPRVETCRADTRQAGESGRRTGRHATTHRSAASYQPRTCGRCRRPGRARRYRPTTTDCPAAQRLSTCRRRRPGAGSARSSSGHARLGSTCTHQSQHCTCRRGCSRPSPCTLLPRRRYTTRGGKEPSLLASGR